MVGKRHKDFRSGDLNEELGVLLLKCFCAVATVPRPDDVGIDAIAILLRNGPNDSLIAENSFYVQFKSSTVRKVKYKGPEVRWLENLKLPFFIGCIRKTNAAIDLYATHRLSQVLLEQPYDEIELVLNPANTVFIGINSQTEDMNELYRRVDIGPVLLSWSTLDLANAEFPLHGYSVIKPYLETEQRNIYYRGIRYIEPMQWETGKPPLSSQPHLHYQSNVTNEEIRHIFQSFAPHLHALSMRAWLTKDRSLFRTVLRLVDYMRDSGFDPDPANFYLSQYKNWERLAFPK